MLLRATIVAIVFSLFTSCSSSIIDQSMSSMVGKPLSAATAKLGFPDQEQVIAGRKVFTWLTSGFFEGTSEKCQIRVIMNGDLIGSFDFYNDYSGACLRYAARLR